MRTLRSQCWLYALGLAFSPRQRAYPAQYRFKMP